MENTKKNVPSKREIQYQSTDGSSSRMDDDSGETESEEIDVQSQPIGNPSEGLENATPDKAGTWPKRVAPSASGRTTPSSARATRSSARATSSEPERNRREEFMVEAEKMVHRAKETGERVGASIRRRSASAGRSIRKRSRSAGRAIKAASVSAGKSIRNRSMSAGREIRRRSISAGKRIRDKSANAGKVVKEKSIVAGRKMKAGSKSAGAKMKKGSVAAGAKMKGDSRAAGKKVRESSKRAGNSIRERSLSAVERMRHRKSSAGLEEEKEVGKEEEEEEEKEEEEKEEEVPIQALNHPRGVMKRSSAAPSCTKGGGKWAVSLQRSRTKTKVKFENAMTIFNKKLVQLPRPQCVRPAGEDDEEEEETASQRTQVEFFEIPSRLAATTAASSSSRKNGAECYSPPRIVCRESDGPDNYFAVLRNGKEVLTPEEEDEEEEDFQSPLTEEEEEVDLGTLVLTDEELEGEEVEPDDEDEKELTPPDPIIAIEETSRDEILGSEFVFARASVHHHRLHLKHIWAAFGQNLRRGPRVGGRVDSLRATFQGRKLSEANDRRLARRFRKFAKAVRNPAAATILTDAGSCFDRSAEAVDELEREILSQFLRPLKMFLKSEAKSLTPKEKELQKMADKIALARSEGVMTQRSFDDLSFRFTNRRDGLLESYSCILEREDDQAERLAHIARGYTKFNADNYVIFNSTLKSLKQSLAQLEKAAADDTTDGASAENNDAGGDGSNEASRTSARPKSPSTAGNVSGGIGVVDWTSAATLDRGDVGERQGLAALLGI